MSWGEIKNLRQRANRLADRATSKAIELERRGNDNRNIVSGYMSSGAHQLSRLNFLPGQARFGMKTDGNKVF